VDNRPKREVEKFRGPTQRRRLLSRALRQPNIRGSNLRKERPSVSSSHMVRIKDRKEKDPRRNPRARRRAVRKASSEAGNATNEIT
jgi:hypothetical protein